MQEIDLAYYAGLIDGEGSIYITRFKRSDTKRHELRYVLFLTVTNQNEQVIRDLKRDFHDGCVFSKRTPKGKEIFVWMIASQKAVNVLLSVTPYLRIKKHEATLAIRFQSFLKPRQGSRRLTIQDLEEREKIRLELSKGRTKGHRIMKFPDCAGSTNNERNNKP